VVDEERAIRAGAEGDPGVAHGLILERDVDHRQHDVPSREDLSES